MQDIADISADPPTAVESKNSITRLKVSPDRTKFDMSKIHKSIRNMPYTVLVGKLVLLLEKTGLVWKANETVDQNFEDKDSQNFCFSLSLHDGL